MTAAGYLNRQQRVPGISQNPVRSFATTTQYIEQNENDRKVANYKCYFQRKDRLMNRGYGAEEKLSARWIWARYLRVIQRAGFGCVQRAESRVAGNDNIRVIAESLHAAIPNISMNVIIGARRHPKKCNAPHSSQDEPNDDNASGNASFKFGRSEKLADRQEVGDSRQRQRGHKVRTTPVAEGA